MSVNKYDSASGELVTLASGTRVWLGTKAAHEKAVSDGTMPNNCMVGLVDDYEDTEVQEFTIESDSFESMAGRYVKYGHIVVVEIAITIKSGTYDGTAVIRSDSNAVPRQGLMISRNTNSALYSSVNGKRTEYGIFWCNSDGRASVRINGTFSENLELLSSLAYITD